MKPLNSESNDIYSVHSDIIVYACLWYWSYLLANVLSRSAMKSSSSFVSPSFAETEILPNKYNDRS